VIGVLEAAPRSPLTPIGRRRRPGRLTGLLLAVLVLAGAVVAVLLSRPSPTPGPGPYSAWVTWPAVDGATSAQIKLDGHLIDRVSTSGGGSYELEGLWPATTFQVQVDVLAARDRVLASYRREVRTLRARRPVPRLYGPNAFVNRPIPGSPRLAPNSSAMVSAAIVSGRDTANLSNGELWGIPIAYAGQHSPRTTVGCTKYDCFVHPGAVGIPAGARPNYGSDHHLVVLEPGGSELDMWLGRRTGNTWTAGSRWLGSTKGTAVNCSSSRRCGGADAADFALAAGLVRPEEIAQGHIDHALAITTPITRRGYAACPAVHGDGTHADPNALPIGAHLQLDPRVDVGRLRIPRWQKVIAMALQRYGAYVIDTGGSVAIYAQSNLGRGFNAWAKAGVPSDTPHLDLPWSSMRVLAMTRCAR
jgi:hypothetical protein